MSEFLLGSASIHHIPPNPPRSGEAVEIEAVIFSDVPVTDAKLLFRSIGQASFREVQMTFRDGVWHGTIPPGSVTDEGLEYALVFELADKAALAFPAEDPLGAPYFLSVQPAAEGMRPFGIGEEGRSLLEADVLIISPEEGEKVPPDEVLIAVSLFNVTGVDIGSLRLLIDDRDVTPAAVVTAEILTYAPPVLEAGVHTAKLELRNIYGYALRPVVWSFAVTGGEARIITAREEFTYSGRVRSDFSLDQIRSETLTIGEGRTILEGGWRWLSFKADVKLTTEESAFKQPRNRYSATIKSGENITMDFGDFTPVLSPYTIDGKRVRGVGVDVDLNWFRFQLVRGELERPIQGLLDADESYMVTDIEVDSSEHELVPVYVLDRRGYTFARDYQAYRLNLNIMNRFQLGLNFHKAKDWTWSVTREIGDAKFTVPLDTSLSVSQIDSGMYTLAEFKQKTKSVAKYRLPGQDWGGADPQDNLVLGFDAGLGFDDRRLTFELAWALSFLNKDIWDGALTLAQMDTALDDSVDGFIGRLYDENGLVTSLGFSLGDMIDPSTLEDFFVVNQNMVPLMPIDAAAYQETPIAAIMNMPSSAYRFKMRAYYYQNTLQVQYSQVGPEFSSLANPYLSSNIREFTLADRIRLFDNKLRVHLSYRHRDNRILKTETDPYSQNTFTTDFTLTPGIDLPAFSFNFESVRRGNGKTMLDTMQTTATPDSLVDLREDTRTRSSLFSISLPVRSGSKSYQFSATLNTIAAVDLLEDLRDPSAGFRSPNSSSRSFSLAATVQHEIPLRTSLTMSQYLFQLPSSTTNDGSPIESRYTSVGFNANYDLWSGKLKFQGGFSFLNASGVSEFAYYGLNGGLEYRLLDVISTRLNLSTKITQTGGVYDLGTLAVKFTANYLF